MWNIKKNMQNREKILFLPLHPLISDLARCLFSVAIPWHSSEELHSCLYTLPENRWTMFRSRSKSMPSPPEKKHSFKLLHILYNAETKTSLGLFLNMFLHLGMTIWNNTLGSMRVIFASKFNVFFLKRPLKHLC